MLVVTDGGFPSRLVIGDDNSSSHPNRPGRSAERAGFDLPRHPRERAVNAGGAGGARTHDPGIMRNPEVPLTRAYSTAVARRALLERIQCGLLVISAHTPVRMRHWRAVPARHLLRAKLAPGKGRWADPRPARKPVELARGASACHREVEGLDPGKQASKRHPCTNSPLVRAWRLGQALSSEFSCHYFDAVSLGQEIPGWVTGPGGWGYQLIVGGDCRLR